MSRRINTSGYDLLSIRVLLSAPVMNNGFVFAPFGLPRLNDVLRIILNFLTLRAGARMFKPAQRFLVKAVAVFRSDLHQHLDGKEGHP